MDRDATRCELKRLLTTAETNEKKKEVIFALDQLEVLRPPLQIFALDQFEALRPPLPILTCRLVRACVCYFGLRVRANREVSDCCTRRPVEQANEMAN